MPPRHLTPALVACHCRPPPLRVVAPSADYKYLMFLGARRSCGQCDSHLRSPFSWQLLFHQRHHHNAQCTILTNSFKKWMMYPVFNFLSFAMKESRFFKMKWCVFADLLVSTLRFIMILLMRCIVKLKTRLLLPLISLFWLSERERSMKMSLQCAYLRILELITSGNVIL